jgi:anti-sigma28 factor (negative regulator of flagellin synthesis)
MSKEPPMRIEIQKAVQNSSYLIKNQKDKPDQTAKEQSRVILSEDQIVLSGDTKQFRQIASQSVSEQIENESVGDDRRALIKKRIAAGHYNQPEVEREIVDRMREFPSP